MFLFKHLAEFLMFFWFCFFNFNWFRLTYEWPAMTGSLHESTGWNYQLGQYTKNTVWTIISSTSFSQKLFSLSGIPHSFPFQRYFGNWNLWWGLTAKGQLLVRNRRVASISRRKNGGSAGLVSFVRLDGRPLLGTFPTAVSFIRPHCVHPHFSLFNWRCLEGKYKIFIHCVYGKWLVECILDESVHLLVNIL